MKKRAAIAAAIVLGAVTPIAVAQAQTVPRDVPEICTREPEGLGEWLLRIAMCGVGPNR
jgi:hypothetical protein